MRDILGFAVAVPALPDSHDPDPRAWQGALQDAIGGGKGPLVLVGHSLGALAVLRWLLAAPNPIAGAVLVAPPIGPSRLEAIRRFRVEAQALPAALSRARRSLVVVSDADPYLLPTPADVATAFASAGARRLLLPGGGHFSPASGLTPLPGILPFFREMAAAQEREDATLLPPPASDRRTGRCPA
ncbi:hypothetical protein N788_05195 [Arenimonas donghaensis DSM 18148 = HO3-R19]|uniref:AB hydrolase-1 domain-containing protein n=1 Tax=Arenimonas donghaensis DSM 18148 = HO3-R19 TaxID=1121014 RepID=A0A087MHD5_9GAMM|nr:hypothetical protein N788_05195 [Arenimonas donghaensis DSM 18148 = HO3-R19]